jgi:predicted DNA-binding protein
MYRAQILLEPEQRRRLEEVAQREGRSISAVARQVINIGLESLENEAEIWEKRERVLSELRTLREKQPFEYRGDLTHEARQERGEDMERVWQNDA